MAFLRPGSTSTYGTAYEAAKPAPPQPLSDSSRFRVKIFSPYQTYYQGEAVSVSATNHTGPFDILAGHANFFSLVDGGKVLVNTGFQQLEFPVTRGVVRVNGDGVTLFANI